MIAELWQLAEQSGKSAGAGAVEALVRHLEKAPECVCQWELGKDTTGLILAALLVVFLAGVVCGVRLAHPTVVGTPVAVGSSSTAVVRPHYAAPTHDAAFEAARLRARSLR